MLYLFYGTDFARARDRATALSEALRKKRPDALVRRVEAGEIAPGDLTELLGSVGLFEKKYIVLLRRVLEDQILADAVAARAPEFRESEHVFIFVEEAPTKEVQNALSRAAQEVREFARKEQPQKPRIFFHLGDALARRDRQALWLGLTEALNGGASPEEIHGVLAWQVRTLLKAGSAGSPAEAGVAPFAYRKAKQAAQKYTRRELTALSGVLARMYHESHRGAVDFPVALERFALTLAPPVQPSR